MPTVDLVQFQLGFPESIPNLVGTASAVVLLLMLTAIAAFLYQHVTGGIEWPSDEPEEGLRRGDQEDEWDYY